MMNAGGADDFTDPGQETLEGVLQKSLACVTNLAKESTV